MGLNTINTQVESFPAQKIPFSQKDDEWAQRCIEAGIVMSEHDVTRMGKSAREKQLNYEIANGLVDEQDFENAFNPQGLKGINFPAKAQNYPIETQYFGVLKGEELNRIFNWRVRLMNHDAVSTREQELNQELWGIWTDIIKDPNMNEEKILKRLEKYQQYVNYEYQDLREKAADRVLSYGWQTQRMKNKFSYGWYDVLINAEEHYAIDEIMNEAEMSKINPVNITTLGGGDSPYTEDSDMIIIDYWMPVSKVVDVFHEDLTDPEIDLLEEGGDKNSGGLTMQGFLDFNEEQKLSNAQIVSPNSSDVSAYGGYYDEYGNVRCSHVIWSSFTEIMKLEYPDDDGEMINDYVSANYKPKPEKGEKGERHWVRQWWHGYRIAGDIFKRAEPLPRIGERMNNPSVCIPPVVGTTYTYNNQKPTSLLDRAKPYKYLYNIYMRRSELASARDKGVMGEMDFAKIPDGWEPDVWMMYAEMNGWFASDSFKTAKKGPAQGKIAGDVIQRGNETLNMSNVNAIKTNLEMAQYVKQEMSEVLGVPPQRLGQMQERETKGGIDMSIEKSAHITEEWFYIHNDTKLRVLELYLETSKSAWKDYTKDNPKVLDFIDDNLIRNIYKLDGATFAENQYGLYIDSGFNTDNLLNKISQWGLAAMQNQMVSLSALIDAERDHDVIGKIRKLERAEKQTQEREMEKLKMQNEIKARETRMEELKLQMEDQHKQQDLKMQKYEIDMENTRGLEDKDRDGIRDVVELQREKLEQERETERLRLELDYKERMEKAKNDLERDKLAQERDLKLREIKARYAGKVGNKKGD